MGSGNEHLREVDRRNSLRDPHAPDPSSRWHVRANASAPLGARRTCNQLLHGGKGCLSSALNRDKLLALHKVDGNVWPVNRGGRSDSRGEDGGSCDRRSDPV
jgi:hypothetical protein